MRGMEECQGEIITHSNNTRQLVNILLLCIDEIVQRIGFLGLWIRGSIRCSGRQRSGESWGSADRLGESLS